MRDRSFPVAVLRALRSSRLLGCGSIHRELLNNVAYRQHVRSVANEDPLFFVAHRHFLAKGLSARQRAATALHHYRHEVSAFDRSYFDAVYRDSGLLLWHHEVEGGEFDIRLLPGSDVLYEGGASVVLHHNGRRTFVISYSWVPSELFLPEEPPSPATTLFVTRNQAAADHSYQKAFNKAFDRTTPGHLCFAAVVGLAMACGQTRIAAIAANRHPAQRPAHGQQFQVAYDDFWESLQGRAVSPFGYRIDLPMRMTPLEQLDAKARKRAIARRTHIEEVKAGAFEVMRKRLVVRPPQPTLVPAVAAPAWAPVFARSAAFSALASHL